jgi:hypothetical protein
MPIPPHTTQRDLVKLALLMCGDRPGAKYCPPTKGTHCSANAEPWQGYAR